MARLRSSLIAVSAFAVAAVFITALNSGVFSYPYPAARISTLSGYAALDMGGILLGSRRLAADIAWIELLQYYGSSEKPLDQDTQYRLSWDMVRYLAGFPVKEVSHENDQKETGRGREHQYYPDISGGTYSKLFEYTLRVTELDPFFNYAYLYGAGALAWNLDRPDEAIKLLEHGIAAAERFNPEITKDIHQPFWQYHIYLSAIIYKKSGKYGEMTSLLETAVKQPECPNMVKAILANIYQKNGAAVKALKLWLEIYDSKDPTYAGRAFEKITELRVITGI